MAMTNDEKHYGTASKLIHWVSAAVILTLLGVGIYMADLPEEAAGRLQLYGLHKSFGVVALLLVVARLVWLRVSPAPPLPGVFEPKEQLVVKGIQKLLYLLMILVPVSGYVMSNAAGFPVPFFGLFDLPTLVAKSKAIGGFAHEAHEILAYTLAALVALHVAGAIKHRLKSKGTAADILQRML
ncbi:cytochrome b [Endothiovibrio diazotrophicus]